MVEEVEIDDVAEKAKKIGANLGVTNDTPDYDIEEDDSIAKPRVGGTKPEHPKLTSKEKRDLRKSRWEKKVKQKDDALTLALSENAALHARLNQVDNRFSQLDKQQVEKAYDDTALYYTEASRQLADAVSRGDGNATTEAMRSMYQAQKQIENLEAMKQSLSRTPQTVQVPVDQRVVNYANEWAERNSWFKNDSSDDAQIANALAIKLTKEGLNPASEQYWSELDKRLTKFLPDKVKITDVDADDDYDDDEEDTPTPPTTKRQAAPPITSSSGRGDVVGKVKISLPNAFIDNLKQAGMWDDLDKRNKMIKRYADGLKNM